MRLQNNLVITERHNKDALAADLVCDCQNKNFTIYHSGVFKKGLFGIEYTLHKKNKQLFIQAICPKCGNQYIIFDSSSDGSKPSKQNTLDANDKIIINNQDSFAINLKYNYYPQNYQTDIWEGFYIDITPENSKKEYRIWEI